MCLQVPGARRLTWEESGPVSAVVRAPARKSPSGPVPLCERGTESFIARRGPVQYARMSDKTEPTEPNDFTEEELEEELTIAATGADEDPEREERFQELLDERDRREDDSD